jgi:predicted DsbA family dithiol-disulfide isomerase
VRRFGAAIEWRPFDLHPEFPPEGIPKAVLERRLGGDFSAGLHRMFDEAGLPYAQARDKVPNSRRALALGELARDRGVHDELHPRLFDAYWARNLDLHDPEVLVSEAAHAGLQPDEVRVAIDDPGYIARIADQTQTAAQLGVRGVPGWVVDERLLIPGAQPYDVFEQVMERLGHTPTET